MYSLDLFSPQATSNLRSGRQLIVHDVDAELGDDGVGRMFNAIGIKAIITAPLVKDNRLVAMMAVHQATPRRWSARDVALVSEVVERCWAHIERVRDAAMLREQDRRKDEFLATLAPIRYAVELMRRATDPDQQLRAKDVISRQVAHMTRLIDDLLDLSRINRGLIELKREGVDLNRLVEQAVETARPAIEAARHTVHVALPPQPLWVDADPARIVQAIANLLNNAAKYTPDGGSIRIAAAPAGAAATVEVTDNGVGIPLAQQGQLFQMFTPLPHTAERAQGRLGIGLSLVKSLVDLHGGSIQVHSAGLGERATFTLHLPLAAPASAAATVVAPPAAAARAPVAAELRVLVIEDHADGRASLVALLHAMGHEPSAAADGLSGLQLAQSLQPHVVPLDIGLPGMDGYAVAQALRAQPQFKPLHLVQCFTLIGTYKTAPLPLWRRCPSSRYLGIARMGALPQRQMHRLYKYRHQ